MAALSELDRTVIAMRYLQQRSLAETAIALRISEAAAKKRLARAMERLRGRLTPFRRVVTVAAVTALLEQAATVTAPPALAGVVSASAVTAVPLGATSSALWPWLTHGPVWGVSAAVLVLAVGAWLMFPRSPAVERLVTVVPNRVTTAGNSPAPTRPPAVAPMPALADLSPQERRIYELIYQLRTAVPPDRPEEWIATLRELIAIGPAAVPALCVELDRAAADKEQRLVIMALRIIGDTRAVPTLIRALPRLATESSDYGLKVADADQRAFLRAHYWNRQETTLGDDDCSFNRGITECVAALEWITGHSEGHQPLMELAPAGQAEELIQRRLAFGRRWQAWWEANTPAAVTQGAVADVDAVRSEGDVVAAVGQASPSVAFPTGPFTRLSPERGVTLRDRFYVDQPQSEKPAFLSLQDDQLRPLGAERQTQGDLYVTSAQFVDGRKLNLLAAEGLKAWLIDNGRFESIAEEVRRPEPLAVGKGPYNHTMVVDGLSGAIVEEPYPATFLIQGRYNVRAVVRVIGPDADGRGLKIRYRRWEQAVPSTQP